MEQMIYIIMLLVAAILLWAMKVATDMKVRKTHHDSRKGSFYEISNRKDN